MRKIVNEPKMPVSLNLGMGKPKRSENPIPKHCKILQRLRSTTCQGSFNSVKSKQKDIRRDVAYILSNVEDDHAPSSTDEKPSPRKISIYPTASMFQVS